MTTAIPDDDKRRKAKTTATFNYFGNTVDLYNAVSKIQLCGIYPIQ
jgi:hypothetical protein